MKYFTDDSFLTPTCLMEARSGSQKENKELYMFMMNLEKWRSQAWDGSKEK